MGKITTIQDHFPKIPRIETVKVEFAYESDDYTNFCITAEVEVSGEGARRSYTCTNHDAERGDGGELSDSMWRRIAERAEEIVWEREEAPKNRRTGCECPPREEGLLSQMIHEDTCPIKLSKDERAAFNDLLAKEQRGTYRSSYEQEQRRQIDENTRLYLELK